MPQHMKVYTVVRTMYMKVRERTASVRGTLVELRAIPSKSYQQQRRFTYDRLGESDIRTSFV